MISDLKVWFSQSYIASLFLPFLIKKNNTKELFNMQFPPTVSIYSSANSFGE